MIEVAIERLIPHRDRMKLIDSIVEVGDHAAVTASKVTREWPLLEGDTVNPLVLLELIAQTSAVTIGWKKLQEDGDAESGKGWLVGIKAADFPDVKIPVNARITTRSEINFTMDNYTEMHGISTIGSERIGEATLQVMRAEEEDASE